jgi:hypothetical protein
MTRRHPTVPFIPLAVGGSPQDFAALLAEEAPKWLDVVKSSGIKID